MNSAPSKSQTSKEVLHVGKHCPAGTPTANVRNGICLQSHPASRPFTTKESESNGINQKSTILHVKNMQFGPFQKSDI